MLTTGKKFYIHCVKNPVGFLGALGALGALSPLFLGTMVVLFFC